MQGETCLTAYDTTVCLDPGGDTDFLFLSLQEIENIALSQPPPQKGSLIQNDITTDSRAGPSPKKVQNTERDPHQVHARLKRECSLIMARDDDASGQVNSTKGKKREHPFRDEQLSYFALKVRENPVLFLVL
jgi:hypothetical protein